MLRRSRGTCSTAAPQLKRRLLCALSPLGLYDAQKLLETDDPGRRLRRLQKLVEEVAELTHSLLAGGGEPTLS